jgi:hypothetical protein
VVGWAGANSTLVMKMFASRMMPSVTHKRVERIGFGGSGPAGRGWLAWPRGGLTGLGGFARLGGGLDTGRA